MIVIGFLPVVAHAPAHLLDRDAIGRTRCLQSDRAPASARSDAATEAHFDEIEGHWRTKNLRGNDEFYHAV
jgi:hypothetical protein